MIGDQPTGLGPVESVFSSGHQVLEWPVLPIQLTTNTATRPWNSQFVTGGKQVMMVLDLPDGLGPANSTGTGPMGLEATRVTSGPLKVQPETTRLLVVV